MCIESPVPLPFFFLSFFFLPCVRFADAAGFFKKGFDIGDPSAILALFRGVSSIVSCPFFSRNWSMVASFLFLYQILLLACPECVTFRGIPICILWTVGGKKREKRGEGKKFKFFDRFWIEIGKKKIGDWKENESRGRRWSSCNARDRVMGVWTKKWKISKNALCLFPYVFCFVFPWLFSRVERGRVDW